MVDSTSKMYKEIMPVIREWVRFQSYYRMVPGLTLAIQVKDEIILNEAFGVKNLETKEPMTTETMFRIASHSKVFTATKFVELFAEDKISPEDKVSKHLDWFKPKNDDIRIKHLLTHASGLTRDAKFGHWMTHKFPDQGEFEAILQEDFEIYETLSEFKYSNIAFGLLGQILEKVTNHTYTELMVEFTSRLGLHSTTPNLLDRNQSLITRHATGHDRWMPNEERKMFDHIEAKTLDSATGFSSTALDLLKFYRAHQFDQDRGLKFRNYWKREMQRTQFYSDIGKVDWGYGFERWKVKDMQILGHSGGYPGFITISGFNQESEIGVAILNNCLGPPPLLDGVFLLLQYSSNSWDDYNDDRHPNLTKYEGLYRNRWGIIQIKRFNGQLMYIQLLATNPVAFIHRLKYLEGNTFIAEDGTQFSGKGEKIEFVEQNGEYELHWLGSILKSWNYNY